MARSATCRSSSATRSRELTQPDALLPGLGFDTWQPRVKPIIESESRRARAGERAGLKVGDEILAIDGEPLTVLPAAGEPRQAQPGTHCHACRCAATARVRDIRVTIGEDMQGGTQGRPDRHRAARDQRIPTGRTVEDMQHDAEVRRRSRAVGQAATQDVGHVDFHAADRRAHHHRRGLVAGDLRADRYRGNNRRRRAPGLATVPEHCWR